jgi:hypothetical protein
MEGTAMFKNRSIQMKVVKDETPTYDVTVGDTLDAVSEMIAKNVKPVAVAVAAVIASKTLSEIAIHTAKTYIK